MRNEGTISESIKSNSFSALDVCFFLQLLITAMIVIVSMQWNSGQVDMEAMLELVL